MSHRIRLLPSQHEFDAEPHETLLEAALRSGLNLIYKCSNGSCGECRGRIVEGAAGKVDFHDFRFTVAEQALGHILLCRAHSGGDMVLEAREIDSATEVPLQRIPTRIAKLEPINSDYLLLYLRTPRTNTLQFLAGQYVRLSIPGVASRELAVASCPCNGLVLQFHVRKDVDDPFSSYLFEQASLKERVDIDGPFGDFVIDEAARRPLLLIGLDNGFAPLKSLVEHAIALEWNRPVRLLRLSSSANDTYMVNYCRSWVDALDDYRFATLEVGAEGGADAGPIIGAVEQLLAEDGELDSYELFISGPAALASRLSDYFNQRGVPPGQIKGGTAV